MLDLEKCGGLFQSVDSRGSIFDRRQGFLIATRGQQGPPRATAVPGQVRNPGEAVHEENLHKIMHVNK
jgi:hypothetical protein